MTPNVLNVPFIYQSEEFLCVPACFRMCLEYLHSEGKIETTLYDEEIRRLLRTTCAGSTWNPKRTHKEFKQKIKQLNVIQLKGAHLVQINAQIDMGMPAIVHYNHMKYEFDMHGSSAHAAVVVGHTDENLIVHDPSSRANTSLFINQFMEAWEEERKRATVFKIDERNTRLDRWSNGASV